MSQTIDLHVVGSSSRELLEKTQGGATYVFENVDTYGQGVTAVTLRKVPTPVRSLPVGCTAQLVKPLKLTEGTVLTEFPAGTQVRIGGYANFGGADVAVINVIGRHFAGTILPELLEAVPTAQQIAAEERAHQIELMADIFRDAGSVGVQPGVAALYDAGYRKS